MASSVENLDFSKYDLVLCSSSGFAHGAITKPETKFIVYYHSPARYIWDWTNEYKADLWLNSGWKRYIMKPLIKKLFLNIRIWDVMASVRSDLSIANSLNTQNRIRKYYKKDSIVLYPPVETERFAKKIENNLVYNNPFFIEWWLSESQSMIGQVSEWNKKWLLYTETNHDYYIIISALTEFKKLDIAINAFNKLNANLLIIWAWDYKETLEKQITWKNIAFAGAKYGDELVSLVQNSLWLIFPWEEDFWIVPIEVMAAWKPVFAYNWWWLTETVLAWITWEFFDDKLWSDFVEKFELFHRNNLSGKYTKEACKKQAEKIFKWLIWRKTKENNFKKIKN